MVGTACWVSVRADHRACRGASLGQVGERADLRAQVGADRGRRRRGRSSISAVSSTSWLVRPRCSQRGGVGVRSRRRSRSSATSGIDRVAAGLGAAASDPVDVAVVDQAGEVGRGAAGRDAGVDQRVEPGRLDRDHRREERRVRERSPARSSPGQKRSLMRQCRG